MSERATQEISEEERRYKDGADPQVLDVVEIQFVSSQPQRHQSENHLIDAGYDWIKRGTVSWSDLQAAVENAAGPLWLDGYSSTHGGNDRVPEGRLNELPRSLYLLKPDGLRLIVGLEGGTFAPARRRVRARFSVSGRSYCLSVTDPEIEGQYLAGRNGETPLDADTLLCVSLGELFHGFAYKLVAAVITRQRAGG